MNTIVPLGDRNYLLLYQDGLFEILMPSGDRSVPDERRFPRREYLTAICYEDDGYMELNTYSAIGRGAQTFSKRLLNSKVLMSKQESARVLKSVEKIRR